MFNDLSSWDAPGIVNPEARHKFALNTCNGCHSSQETNTGFLMVGPRAPGQQAFLSPFLTGTSVFDPATGGFRVLNDLRRRNRDMHLIVCPDDPLPPDPMPPPGRPVADGGAPGGGPRPSPPPMRAAVPAPARVAPAFTADPPTSLIRGIGRVH